MIPSTLEPLPEHTLTPLKDQSETILIRPLANVDRERLADYLPGTGILRLGECAAGIDLDEADASRLARVLLHRNTGPAAARGSADCQ